MLEVEHLCFSYGKREVLRGVDLRTEPAIVGELKAFIGHLLVFRMVGEYS